MNLKGEGDDASSPRYCDLIMLQRFMRTIGDHLSLVVLISLTLLEILILIPYVLHNNLHAFDAIGHYAAVLFMKRHLFPYPSGWNPYHYAGYPLNVFYHPLFSYLVCLLSFLVPFLFVVFVQAHIPAQSPLVAAGISLILDFVLVRIEATGTGASPDSKVTLRSLYFVEE